MIGIPSVGYVLGIDIGWSTKHQTSAVCCLFWDDQNIDWKMRLYRACHQDRAQALRWAAKDRTLLAVAVDGPLRRGFSEIGRYRSAERLLSRGQLPRVGKPAQSSSGFGKRLNEQANLAARFVRKHCRVRRASTYSPD